MTIFAFSLLYYYSVALHQITIVLSFGVVHYERYSVSKTLEGDMYSFSPSNPKKKKKNRDKDVTDCLQRKCFSCVFQVGRQIRFFFNQLSRQAV